MEEGNKKTKLGNGVAITFVKKVAPVTFDTIFVVTVNQTFGMYMHEDGAENYVVGAFQTHEAAVISAKAVIDALYLKNLYDQGLKEEIGEEKFNEFVQTKNMDCLAECVSKICNNNENNKYEYIIT
jgi:hypothetical protein